MKGQIYMITDPEDIVQLENDDFDEEGMWERVAAEHRAQLLADTQELAEEFCQALYTLNGAAFIRLLPKVVRLVGEMSR